MTASHPRATLIGLAAVLCWSTSVGLFRSVAEQIGPVAGAASAFTLSALFVTLRFGLPRLHRLRGWHPAYVFGCGLIFVAYEIGLALSLGFASDRGQSLELGMINYLWPSLTVVLATAAGLQRFHPGLIPGVLLAMSGIALVLRGDGAFSVASMWANVQGNPLAYGLAFAAALLWPCYSVTARLFARGANALPLFLWGTAACLWIHFALGQEHALRMSWAGAAQLLMLGTLTALGYSCWDHGIRHGNLTVMAVGSYFTPVLSALAGAAWLQVRPSWSFWQGVALVTLGSLVCWVSARRAA
ncbi:aromatic amino acid DMT transporter YddG [Diaphorobacter ruginosibacter]|uniref:aromatic amino acid DMT transporter YddG n=1 Tax=Diaphorobacter ruginosibacter TaxID=1715720 RepID=UPI0033426348